MNRRIGALAVTVKARRRVRRDHIGQRAAVFRLLADGSRRSEKNHCRQQRHPGEGTNKGTRFLRKACPRAPPSADPWARNDRIVLASCAPAGAADPPWMKRLSRRRPGPTYPQLVLPKDGPRLSPGKCSIIRAVTNALFLAMSAATKQSRAGTQNSGRPHLSSHTAARSWLM